jgi:hypothetical protein
LARSSSLVSLAADGVDVVEDDEDEDDDDDDEVSGVVVGDKISDLCARLYCCGDTIGF